LSHKKGEAKIISSRLEVTIKESTKPHSIVMEFSPEAYRRLAQLKSDLGASSEEDVIRDALSFLAWGRGQVKDGKAFYLGKKRSPLEVQRVHISVLRE
jgi:hypothetical protein